jgi:hypothetical protein
MTFKMGLKALRSPCTVPSASAVASTWIMSSCELVHDKVNEKHGADINALLNVKYVSRPLPHIPEGLLELHSECLDICLRLGRVFLAMWFEGVVQTRQRD